MIEKINMYKKALNDKLPISQSNLIVVNIYALTAL